MSDVRSLVLPFGLGVLAGAAAHRWLAGPSSDFGVRTPVLVIPDVAELRRHVQVAIQLELMTIPAYLYAYWSVDEHDRTELGPAIRSVALEEMLHLTTACNLLRAIGGTPTLYDRAKVPTWPSRLPNHTPDLPVGLGPASTATLDTFLAIEQPEAPSCLPDQRPPDMPHDAANYRTIAEFYEAIEHCLRTLDGDPASRLWENTQTKLQFSWFAHFPRGDSPLSRIDPDSFNVTGTPEHPQLGPITDLRTAQNGIRSIIRQGEGATSDPFDDGERRELAHFAKFTAIRAWLAQGWDDRRTPLRIHPCLHNPRAADLPKPLGDLATFGNASWCYLLKSLDFIGSRPDGDHDRDRVIAYNFRALMSDVLTPVGRFLAASPIPGTDRTAGMPFEFYVFATDSPAKDQVLALWTALPRKLRDQFEGCGASIDGLMAVP